MRHADPEGLLASLFDHLTRERVEIDMVKFCGPAFAGVDNRLMCLQLIERAFTDTALFTAQGEVVQPAEVLYQRPILVERGRFRPVNLLSMDLLERGLGRHLDGTQEYPGILLREEALGNRDEDIAGGRDCH